MTYIVQITAAFFATFSFSVMFGAPKTELIYCGLAGAGSWTMFLIVGESGGSKVAATFFAVLVISLASRILAATRHSPITVFLFPGIIPLVPGAGIYGTMYSLIINESAMAAAQGLEAMKIAGVIAIGIIAVLSLPRSWFAVFSRQTGRR